MRNKKLKSPVINRIQPIRIIFDIKNHTNNGRIFCYYPCIRRSCTATRCQIFFSLFYGKFTVLYTLYIAKLLVNTHPTNTTSSSGAGAVLLSDWHKKNFRCLEGSFFILGPCTISSRCSLLLRQELRKFPVTLSFLWCRKLNLWHRIFIILVVSITSI
jgi:hypothetical protein